MENESITINFPNKLLRFELKEYLEYKFKVYIKKDETDLIVFGNELDLKLCQEQAEYFKSVDSTFLLHLNKFSKEALSISSLKLFLQSTCKVLMSIDDNVLYFYGQLFNTTCIYNYLCQYTNMIENEPDYNFSDSDETNLNFICRNLGINLPSELLKKSKIFIYIILKNRDEFLGQFDNHEIIESSNLNKVEIFNINEKTSDFDSGIKLLKSLKIDETDILSHIPDKSQKYRTVIIDGSNVGHEHGNGEFSPKGIKLAVDYFINRGHTVVHALLPKHYLQKGPDIFPEMELNQHLKYTPSRIINNRYETPYDDRIILEAASLMDGVVVSNDQFRDVTDKYKDIICERLIPYAFVGDHFIIPEDPRGPKGPNLDELLTYKDTAVQPRNKKPIQTFKNNKPVKTFPKTANKYIINHQSRQKKLNQEDIKIELYNEAIKVLPSDKTAIKEIIDANPQIFDLNTLIDLVLLSKNK